MKIGYDYEVYAEKISELQNCNDDLDEIIGQINDLKDIISNVKLGDSTALTDGIAGVEELTADSFKEIYEEFIETYKKSVEEMQETEADLLNDIERGR